MNKKTVVVVFGGCSSEHEVSCVSATTVISNINTEEYDIIMIGITKEGRWLKVENIKAIQSGAWTEGTLRSWDRQSEPMLYVRWVPCLLPGEYHRSSLQNGVPVWT